MVLAWPPPFLMSTKHGVSSPATTVIIWKRVSLTASNKAMTGNLPLPDPVNPIPAILIIISGIDPYESIT